MNEIPKAIRTQVYERDQWCRRCGRSGGPFSIHHRKGRRSHDLSNLVLLCGTGTTGCHGYITEHPAEAYDTGWCVHRLSDDDPEQIPLTDLHGRQFFLTDTGGDITNIWEHA